MVRSNCLKKVAPDRPAIIFPPPLIFIAFLVLHFGVVKPEEKYLARKFGDEFQDYRSKVRRWL
jgi:protein-S-isoprenylcysteine O-methyltransferase Ste14